MKEYCHLVNIVNCLKRSSLSFSMSTSWLTLLSIIADPNYHRKCRDWAPQISHFSGNGWTTSSFNYMSPTWRRHFDYGRFWSGQGRGRCIRHRNPWAGFDLDFGGRGNFGDSFAANSLHFFLADLFGRRVRLNVNHDIFVVREGTYRFCNNR